MSNDISTENKSTSVSTDIKLRTIVPVESSIYVLSTHKFEHLQRIATVMATSNLIPDSLCMEGTRDDRKPLPFNTVMANCFLVTNQAVRWEMDPFAVAQCVSVVHGKLCYEGKLIAAILQAKIGVDLEYEITGQNDAMKIVVSAAVNGKPVLDSKGKPKTIEGTVGEWKTTNSGSPWAARGGSVRMLRYRGAREWARVHAPGLMLGVYSDDEMDELNDNMRASQATNVTPPKKIPPPPDEISSVEAATVPVPPVVPPPEGNHGVAGGASPAARNEPKTPPPPDDGLDIPPLLDRRPKKPSPSEPEPFRLFILECFNAAKDMDALNNAWEAHVEPHKTNIFPPDMMDLSNMFGQRQRQIEED